MKSVFSLFFIVISTCFFSYVVADAKSRKSVTAAAHEFVQTLSEYAGENVSMMVDAFYQNMQNTVNIAKGLSTPEVIDSINYSIKGALQSLREASMGFEKVQDRSEYITAPTFEQFLQSFQTKLMEKVKSRKNISPDVLNLLKDVSPRFIDAVVQTYSNIYENINMGLTYGLLLQGSTMLTLLERAEYVNTKTFEHFASMPTQISSHMDELVGSLVTAETIDLVHSMLKVSLAQAKPREHREL